MKYLDETRTAMGRRKLWGEYLKLPLADGTKERIKAALDQESKETSLDLIRTAIEWELEEREKSARLLKGQKKASNQ